MIVNEEFLVEAKPTGLKPRLTRGAQVIVSRPAAWRLVVPPSPAGRYRLAQVDDYHNLRRSAFLWNPPLRLRLHARASSRDIPGTWGFGLWNDPFGMAVLGGADRLRLPALPNAAWYFFASQPNYLALRDGVPGSGPLAATLCSPHIPAGLLAFGLLCLPLMALPPAVRVIRRLGRRFVLQDGVSLGIDPTEWHVYELEWRAGQVSFILDRETVLKTEICPIGPLAMVMWVDNQYLASPPDGRFRAGTLGDTREAWVEVEELSIDNREQGSSEM